MTTNKEERTGSPIGKVESKKDGAKTNRPLKGGTDRLMHIRYRGVYTVVDYRGEGEKRGQ